MVCKAVGSAWRRNSGDVLARACMEAAGEMDDPEVAEVLQGAFVEAFGGRAQDVLNAFGGPSEVDLPAVWNVTDDELETLSECLCQIAHDDPAYSLEFIIEAAEHGSGDPDESAVAEGAVVAAVLDQIEAPGGLRTTIACFLEGFELHVRETDEGGFLVSEYESAVRRIRDPRALLRSLFDACADFVTARSSIWLPCDRYRVWRGCKEALTVAAGPVAAATALLDALEKAADWAEGPRSRVPCAAWGAETGRPDVRVDAGDGHCPRERL